MSLYILYYVVFMWIDLFGGFFMWMHCRPHLTNDTCWLNVGHIFGVFIDFLPPHF